MIEAIKTPLKSPATVWTNRRIAVGKDLIFQWVLLTVDDEGQQQWLPLDQMEKNVIELVRAEVLDPIFPVELRDYVAQLKVLPNRSVEAGR